MNLTEEEASKIFAKLHTITSRIISSRIALKSPDEYNYKISFLKKYEKSNFNYDNIIIDYIIYFEKEIDKNHDIIKVSVDKNLKMNKNRLLKMGAAKFLPKTNEIDEKLAFFVKKIDRNLLLSRPHTNKVTILSESHWKKIELIIQDKINLFSDIIVLIDEASEKTYPLLISKDSRNVSIWSLFVSLVSLLVSVAALLISFQQLNSSPTPTNAVVQIVKNH